MKLLFLDLETSGLFPDKHGITQIAGEVEIDGETKETFNWNVKPFGDQEIAVEALNITGKTMGDLEGYPVPGTIFAELEHMLKKYVNKFDKGDKFFIVGYNSHAFDQGFLRQFFLNNQHKYYGSYFWSAGFDVMLLAVPVLADRRHRMKNFQLRTVAEEFGIEIEEEKLHDANYDIYLTKKIFNRIRKET